MYVTVVLPDRAKVLGDGLTYRSDASIAPGSLVRIQVRNRFADGIVIDHATESMLDAARIKSVNAVLSTHPLLPSHLLATAKWMADRYCTTLRSVLANILPSPPWNTLLPKTVNVYALTSKNIVRGPKQKLIVDLLTKGPQAEETLLEESGVAKSILTAMVKRGIIEMKIKSGPVEGLPKFSGKKISIPKSWHTAATKLARTKGTSLLVHHNEQERLMLFGELAMRKLTDGKSVIMLFPEAYLAKRATIALRKIIGNAHVLLHNPLGPREDRRQLHRIAMSGSPCVIVGTRSSLFVPLASPGLVIIDDEHDWLYKSERTPMYHARDVAQTLCKEAHADLILASASPSAESWSRTSHTTLPPLNITKRVVTLVNLKDVHFGTSYPLSPTCVLALQDNWRKGEKSVVFLNHRGEATGIICTECKELLSTTADGHPLTVYTDSLGRPYLRNLSTGNTFSVPTTCPKCGSHALRSAGAGTQAVERLVRKFLPSANIVRIDSDSTEGAERRDLFDRFEAGKYDIAIGTQSVLPALENPQVSLAAAIIADVGLSIPHVRAGEHAVQLLTTLKKALRHKKGRVIIQTFSPLSREMQAIKKDHIAEFMDEEIRLREMEKLPPSTKSATIILRGPNAQKDAKVIFDQVKGKNADIELTASQRQPLWYVHVRGDDAHEIVKPYADHIGVSIDIEPLYRL